MTRRIVCATLALVIGLGTLAVAAQARTYAKSVDLVWDDAVKAVRDVKYYMGESDRDEGWFVFHTRRTGGHEIKVQLLGSGTQATVQVGAVDPEDDEDCEDHVAKYLAALDKRLD